jgi:hypothetical protein
MQSKVTNPINSMDDASGTNALKQIPKAVTG